MTKLLFVLNIFILTSLNIDAKNKIKNKMSFDSAPTSPDESFNVDFVGKGDIQKSLNQGDEIQANTGLGIIFERFKKNGNIQTFELESTINIASTVDTINAKIENNQLINRRDFGTYVLNPISTKQAFYLNSNILFGNYENGKFGKLAKVISGVNLRFITSNNVWSYNNQSVNLGVFSGRIGVFHEFWPDNYRVNEKGRTIYSCTFGLNYCARGIVGDITNPTNKTLYKNILNTEQKFYNGVELNFGFRLNNIRAEFQVPMIAIKKFENPLDISNPIKNSVEGLTNTQFIFSIKFIGGFSMKLDKVENK